MTIRHKNQQPGWRRIFADLLNERTRKRSRSMGEAVVHQVRLMNDLAHATNDELLRQRLFEVKHFLLAEAIAHLDGEIEIRDQVQESGRSMVLITLAGVGCFHVPMGKLRPALLLPRWVASAAPPPSGVIGESHDLDEGISARAPAAQPLLPRPLPGTARLGSGSKPHRMEPLEPEFRYHDHFARSVARASGGGESAGRNASANRGGAPTATAGADPMDGTLPGERNEPRAGLTKTPALAFG